MANKMKASQEIRDVTGVLLAGGKSQRMGKDKRTLVLEGKTLVDRSLAVLLEIFPEVIVVLGQHDFPIHHDHVRIVKDLIPDRAAAGGLYTGLHFSTHSRVFVVACDMPFLNGEVIRYVTSISAGYDITLVELGHGLQTMHAVYSKRCLAPLEHMVKREHLRLQDLLLEPTLTIHKIAEGDVLPYDKHLLSFMNLNSPADYELARKMCGMS